MDLTIPREAHLTLSAKERARLLYVGKRNRPMFLLQENATLSINGKIELYYNTNNTQEALQLMFRTQQGSRFALSKEVKISLFSYKPEQPQS